MEWARSEEQKCRVRGGLKAEGEAIQAEHGEKSQGTQRLRRPLSHERVAPGAGSGEKGCTLGAERKWREPTANGVLCVTCMFFKGTETSHRAPDGHG